MNVELEHVGRNGDGDGSGPGFENGIKTMIEKVGEGEITPTD